VQVVCDVDAEADFGLEADAAFVVKDRVELADPHRGPSPANRAPSSLSTLSMALACCE